MTIKPMLKIMAAGLCLSGAGARAETFRAATFNAANSPVAAFIDDFAADVAERTGGEIEFELFAGGSLLPGEGTLVGLQRDVAQLANINASQIPSDMPYDNVISDLGFIGDDQMALAFATTELRFFNEQAQQEIQRNNLVFASGNTIGIWNIICREPISSLAELKGKKIRGTGGAQIAFIEHIGGTVVSVPPTEIYTGLQRGSLDCTAGSPEFLTVFWRLSEIAKSVYLLPLGSLPTGGYYFSESFWQDRSVDERRAMLGALSRSTAKSLIEWSDLIDEAFETARQENIALTEPTPEDMATLTSFSDDFVENLAQAEITKRNIDDPTPLIEDMVRLVDKWKGLLAGIDTSDVDAVTALLDQEIYGKIDVETYGMN
ncbi:TRAP-type C4-dicarboxylate transport system, substrate-binding protein [Paracoccus halophilus]|nr:C4-dicarboxylate TRAP transporter substrate-binding protein [Paracoccus halophilus]SFA62358.1 TRAP-type C4-dicarboxylate transport system, substrate-binding protein [Paracoccus halophilus]